MYYLIDKRNLNFLDRSARVSHLKFSVYFLEDRNSSGLPRERDLLFLETRLSSDCPFDLMLEH